LGAWLGTHDVINADGRFGEPSIYTIARKRLERNGSGGGAVMYGFEANSSFCPGFDDF
jgi:hypothetical protein